MTLPNPVINVYFGYGYGTGATDATYDNATKGVYDSVTYLYVDAAGDPIPISTDAYEVSIVRGRSRELDEFEAGSCTVNLRNFDRTYDGLNTAGIYYGDLTPGKRITIALYGVTIFDGTIEDWDTEWTVAGDASARIFAIDALGQLGMKDFDAWTTTASQTAGARLTDILNRPEVAFSSQRDLDTGTTSLQSDSVTWGSNVLNYAQLVVQSEGGRLFCSRDGQLTFDDRYSMVSSTELATFADDGTGYKFNGVTTATGSDFLYNKVGVDRLSGTLQTVTGDTTLGVRALSITDLLMDTDAAALDMATYLLSIYEDPATRISSITVRLERLAETDRATVASLDMGDVIRVKWTPGRVGSQVSQIVAVEGVEHDIQESGHTMTFQLSPVFQQAVAYYDDAVRGVYDSTDYVYAF